jgi:hypothetical protein
MLGTTPSHPSETQQVCFSSILKGKPIKLYDNARIANGDKGYRSLWALKESLNECSTTKSPSSTLVGST